MHPKYDTYTLANDVALIELEGPILGAKPVKLARASTVGHLAFAIAACAAGVVAGHQGPSTQDEPLTLCRCSHPGTG